LFSVLTHQQIFCGHEGPTKTDKASAEQQDERPFQAPGSGAGLSESHPAKAQNISRSGSSYQIASLAGVRSLQEPFPAPPAIKQSPIQSRVSPLATQSMSYASQASRINPARLSRKIQNDLHVSNCVEWHLTSVPAKTNMNDLAAKASFIMADVEHRYWPEGCEARAHHIIEKGKRHFSKKHFFRVSFRSDTLISATGDEFQGVNWTFHVAAAVVSKKNKIYVLDPLVSKDKAVELVRWIGLFDFGQHLSLKLLSANVDIVGETFPRALKAQYKANLAQVLVMNEAIMRSYDYHFHPMEALKEASFARSHFCHPKYAYSVNIGDASSEQKLSFDYSISYQLWDAQWYFDAVNLHLVDGLIGITYPLFLSWNEKEQSFSGASPQQVQQVMQQLAISRIEVVSVPVHLENLDPMTDQWLGALDSQVSYFQHSPQVGYPTFSVDT